jgi:hypothetical protein
MWMCRAAYAGQVRSWPGGSGRYDERVVCHGQDVRVRINLVDAVLITSSCHRQDKRSVSVAMLRRWPVDMVHTSPRCMSAAAGGRIA